MDRMSIEGSPELQLAISKIHLKYRHVFSDKFDAKPASILPVDLLVNKTK